MSIGVNVVVREPKKTPALKSLAIKNEADYKGLVSYVENVFDGICVLVPNAERSGDEMNAHASIGNDADGNPASPEAVFDMIIRTFLTTAILSKNVVEILVDRIHKVQPELSKQQIKQELLAGINEQLQNLAKESDGVEVNFNY